MELTLLTKRRVLMLGFGVEHQALARWLLAQGVRLTVRTTDMTVSAEEYAEGLTIEHTQQPLQNLASFDVVLRPGVLVSTHPALQRFARDGGTVLTALQVLLSRCQARTIGVAGTRGKHTTAVALEQLLRLTYQDGKVMAASTAEAFDLLDEMADGDILILPLADTELEGLAVAPSFLVCLDGGPQKAAVAAAQRPSDTLFLSMHQEGAQQVRASAHGRIRELHAQQPRREAAWLAELEGGRVVFWEHAGEVYSFRLTTKQRGAAFAEALAHACLVADTLGIPHEHIQAHLSQVSVAPHRLQVIAALGGCVFVDDAASCDVTAREHALRAYQDERVHLITDGVGSLPVGANLASVTVLPGGEGKLVRSWERGAKQAGIELMLLPQQPTCLRLACSQLSNRLQENDVVLFSPGMTARKPFRSIEERGAAFLEAVQLYAKQA